MSPLPEALVLRWDSSSLRVDCPYCLYSHCHGYGRIGKQENIDQTQQGWRLRRSLERMTRMGDCHDMQIFGRYTFAFPLSAASGYGWEFNRATGEITTMNRSGEVEVPINDGSDGRTLLPQYKEQNQGSSTNDDSESDSDELIAATEGLNLTDRPADREPESRPIQTAEEILKELYCDPKYRQAVYISSCCLRDIGELDRLFKHYPEDEFIEVLTEEGDNGVLLAATEENGMETVRWLQERGCSIHHANHYGRTPLMEAALWGRLETVKYLVDKGADVGVRDANDMRANDLAAGTKRNTNERAHRAGQMYRERSDASRQREMSRALLARHLPHAAQNVGTETGLGRQAFFHRKQNGELEIYRPQVLLEIPYGPKGPQLQKAFATLDRGSHYPYVNAMSGYSHPDWPNVLDNKVWTDKADDLREMLDLTKDKRAASHVEPQILAYLLDRHSLHRTSRSEDDYDEFASIMPAYTLRPVVTVNKPDFCSDCLDFFLRFKTRFPDIRVVFHFVGDALAPVQIRE